MIKARQNVENISRKNKEYYNKTENIHGVKPENSEEKNRLNK